MSQIDITFATVFMVLVFKVSKITTAVRRLFFGKFKGLC